MEEFASTNSYREGTEAEEWRADGDKSVCSCVCKWNPELMVVVVLDFDAVALGCVVQVFFFFFFKRLFVRPGTSSSVFNACASEGLTSGGSQQAEGR